MKKHIPNFFTISNLAFGCIAIVYIFKRQAYISSFLVFAALIFDFLDGFLARKLKAGSPIGKELDSLADLVTFGVAPGMLVYSYLRSPDVGYWAFLAFLLPIFSAIRLARFNVTEKQSHFSGLPTPANAFFWMSFPCMFLLGKNNDIYDFFYEIFHGSEWRLISVVLFFSVLMVSNIKMMSFKFSNFGMKDNWDRYLFLGISLILFLILQLTALPIIVFLYLIISLVTPFRSN